MRTMTRIAIALERIAEELHKFIEPTIITGDPIVALPLVEKGNEVKKSTKSHFWTEEETALVRDLMEKGLAPCEIYPILRKRGYKRSRKAVDHKCWHIRQKA